MFVCKKMLSLLMKKYLLLIVVIVSMISSGCKTSTTAPGSGQSVAFTFHNFKPNRLGEVYALWVEIPKSAAPIPVNPLHGLVLSKLVSTFTVTDTGIVGFDTTGFSNRLGVNFSLMIRAEVSVERKDNISSVPTADFIGGNISGSYSVGTATLTGEDPLAFGTSLPAISGLATLATLKYTPSNYVGEVYLMNVASDSTKSAGLINLAVLPSSWQYGIWTVDSISKPPIQTFLGYVVTPDSKDTKSTHDNFNFPGGLTLDSTGRIPLNLTYGASAVLVSLEPILSTNDPVIPFPAPVLYGLIPSAQPPYVTFPLQNIVRVFPSVDMKIAR